MVATLHHIRRVFKINVQIVSSPVGKECYYSVKLTEFSLLQILYCALSNDKSEDEQILQAINLKTDKNWGLYKAVQARRLVKNDFKNIYRKFHM